MRVHTATVADADAPAHVCSLSGRHRDVYALACPHSPADPDPGPCAHPGADTYAAACPNGYSGPAEDPDPDADHRRRRL